METESAFPVVIAEKALHTLVCALQKAGYRVIGPILRDQAIVYDELDSVADLPQGWTDEQQPGSYRLKKRTDQALFGYTVGPHSWKKFLHPPHLRLWSVSRSGNEVRFSHDKTPIQKYAFLGVRSCELHAMAIQDKVFLQAGHEDAGYHQRRNDSFIIALNCGEAGGTCFCTSMKTGPQATSGFDLALTELLSADRHEFLVEISSQIGANLMHDVASREASAEDLATAANILARTAENMGRHLDTKGLKERLQDNPEHPRWDEVAARCLGCSNCTMVCPTCFCTSVEDTADLAGETAERWRRWDSCFNSEFSYIHGGSIRSSVKSRYRQWLTHKLAHWIDQFGSSGCVGCGRCISWCPTGIDITEEAAAIGSTAPPPEDTS